MTTVAQHYQPIRPIAVGNCQRRYAQLRSTTLGIAHQVTSTFPSLVGSFGNRLGVGNRQFTLILASLLSEWHLATSCINTSQRIPCQASVAFGQRAVRRNHTTIHPVATWRFIALGSVSSRDVARRNSTQRPPFGAASPILRHGRFRDAVSGIKLAAATFCIALLHNVVLRRFSLRHASIAPTTTT